MRWHERKYAGLALRACGLILLALAILISRRLFAVADPQARERPLSYLLAVLGMASACAGAGLTVLGRHLFAQVALSARWTVHMPLHHRQRD
jgi:hypothetical protein